ncbi:YjcG family protein [Metabacillus sp. GX 13764]|uniref:YjcG family protein n=1 Tax=Metabacillus kandeliae TaxID=2900151 RepID=UPI001E2CA64D|nr:YjcG family protein [Metabacillus kandeliae]MCD7035013.1 YjcG family protein [Metabacillus kandeliae]
MKYGIALFPSKKLQDLANSYRKRYDPHYALIPPHLTLKAPFEAHDEDISKISKELRKIGSQIDPLSVVIKKFSSFEPVNRVIYLKVEPSEQLNKLHSLLQEGTLPGDEEYSFVPHITVGQNLSEQEHSDVLSSLRMSEVHHEETIDRFHLLYQLDNGSWTVYETYLLGTGAAE